MRYLFELSGEHSDLPLWEAETLLHCSGNARLITHDSAAAVFSAEAEPDDFSDRLALSHFLSEHICSVGPSEIDSALEGIDLSSVKSAAVTVKMADAVRRREDAPALTRRLGAILAKRTKIRLEEPEVRIRVYVGERAHIGRELLAVDRGQYEKRKNRLLPFVSPISIHPRLARALINVTATSRRSALLDPFCGTGTFLIEAALMGMRTYGSDISQRMIDGSGRNLEAVGQTARLRRLDVGEIGRLRRRFDCIVTDPPYGRSATTMKEPTERLYSRAIEAFASVLREKGRVGMIVPELDMLEYEHLFRLLRRTSLRVHRSLTRNFLTLELK